MTRGVEKTVHGHGSRPSAANKKLTDLDPLAEHRPDHPAVSPGHRLPLDFIFFPFSYKLFHD